MSLNLLQKIILGVGSALVALSLLYVPWLYTFAGDSDYSAARLTAGNREYLPGYSWIFSPPPRFGRTVTEIDWPRALAMAGAVALVTAAGVRLSRRR